MKLKEFIKVSNYRKIKSYKEILEYDKKFNASFLGESTFPKYLEKKLEWKTIEFYRKFQANQDNFWGKYYLKKIDNLEAKTGIHFEANPNIGKGLIIGHWGRIILNGNVKFGDNIFLTHGITIGRDVRGKRAGVPTIGNRVCIRANSTIVGNIIIGDDVLIAPNTFVNFDVPSHSVVIGNPATVHPKSNATEGHLGEII